MRNLKNKALFVKTLDSEDVLKSLALYGGIYEGQEDDYAEMANPKEDVIEQRSRRFWESQFEITPFSSVINLTSFGIAPYEVVSPAEHLHFNIIPYNSIEGLTLFWNLRTTERSVNLMKKWVGAHFSCLATCWMSNP